MDVAPPDTKWEFLDSHRQSNCWREYKIAEQIQLEAAFQTLVRTNNCPPVVLGNYMINIEKWVQQNRTTGYKRTVRRSLRNPGTPIHTWQWEDGHFGSENWRSYSVEVCAELDAATLEMTPLAVAEFGTRPNLYVVNIRQSIQINVRTNKRRRVKKIPFVVPIGEGEGGVLSHVVAFSPFPGHAPVFPSAPHAPMPALPSAPMAPHTPSAPFGSSLSQAAAGLPVAYPIPYTPSTTRPTGSASKRHRGATFGARPADGVVINLPPIKTEMFSGSTITELHIPYKMAFELKEEDECPICMDRLCESEENGLHAIQLSKCHGHAFHMECLNSCINKGALKCPICQLGYGNPLTGNQPSGTMRVTRSKNSCPGYEGYDTFVINYMLPDGIQGNDHPAPGKRYQGTQRVGLIPATEQGYQVLLLLWVAWNRRLIFQVGFSITLGEAAGHRVTWNGIHHKTVFHGEHGYPDAKYLDRVTQELAAVGVTLDDIQAH